MGGGLGDLVSGKSSFLKWDKACKVFFLESRPFLCRRFWAYSQNLHTPILPEPLGNLSCLFSVKCLRDSDTLKPQSYGSPSKTVFSRTVSLSVESTVSPPVFHPNYHECSCKYMVPEVSTPGKQISAMTFCLIQIYFLDGHLPCDFISLIGSRTFVIEFVNLTIVN